MHERRNFVLVLLLGGTVVWVVLAWLLLPDDAPLLAVQRIGSMLLAGLAGAGLLYGMVFEDRLPDHLGRVVGQLYYEADGLCFMPIVRVQGDHAELCVYYQNRFENPVDVVIHLRPLDDRFEIKPGWRDVHFAFKAGGGDFGVIHLPLTVPPALRGEVIDVLLAAASHYGRSHGARLRRRGGMSCGSLLVDWHGAAFRTGVHEVSGEIDLIDPVTLHLALPRRAGASEQELPQTWRQEQLVGGT